MPVVELPLEHWDAAVAPGVQTRAAAEIEAGAVLFFPKLAFALSPRERRFLSERWSDGKSKNISFDPSTGRVKGARGDPAELQELGSVIARFADCAQKLIIGLIPSYAAAVVRRTSLRPFEPDARETSVRKDDRLLHVDAFPSRPNRGARILRVFSNVNPGGEARVWHIGEPFEDVAARFLPRIAPPLPGVLPVLAAIGVTKGTRSRYDHFMLRIHDGMKFDANYQRSAPRSEFPFPAGSTWVCFSDAVSHAVLKGRFLLEQTLELPVAAMREPERSPLRVLERLAGRALA